MDLLAYTNASSSTCLCRSPLSEGALSGLTYDYGKLGIMKAIDEMMK